MREYQTYIKPQELVLEVLNDILQNNYGYRLITTQN